MIRHSEVAVRGRFLAMRAILARIFGHPLNLDFPELGGLATDSPSLCEVVHPDDRAFHILEIQIGRRGRHMS
jgi:hypothetical protein